MRASSRVRVVGPLAKYAAGFAAELTQQGYTDLSLRNQLALMAHFSHWLAARRLTVDGLTPELVDCYVALRRRTRTAFPSRRALVPLFAYLGVTERAAHAIRERSE